MPDQSWLRHVLPWASAAWGTPGESDGAPECVSWDGGDPELS